MRVTQDFKLHTCGMRVPVSPCVIPLFVRCSNHWTENEHQLKSIKRQLVGATATPVTAKGQEIIADRRMKSVWSVGWTNCIALLFTPRTIPMNRILIDLTWMPTDDGSNVRASTSFSQEQRCAAARCERKFHIAWTNSEGKKCTPAINY